LGRFETMSGMAMLEPAYHSHARNFLTAIVRDPDGPNRLAITFGVAGVLLGLGAVPEFSWRSSPALADYRGSPPNRRCRFRCGSRTPSRGVVVAVTVIDPVMVAALVTRERHRGA
jgi:hypothetical protein